MRPAGQLGNLAERAGGDRVVAFLKHECRHPANAELARDIADVVDILLEAVADEHQRIDAPGIGFAYGMAENFADLGAAAKTADLCHPPDELVGRRDPRARLAFAVAAEENQLDFKPAEPVGGMEHLGLQVAGLVPGRLAARRRIHSKQKPAAPARGVYPGRRRNLRKEVRYLIGIRLRRE